MIRYALLNSEGMVEQILTQRPDSGNTIKIPDGMACHVGWIHDGMAFQPPRWTSYQFLLRLTAGERAAIRQLTTTDPNVADFLMLAQSAQEIQSNDPMTQAGMNYMVSIGVFTEQRKNEILGTE